MLDSRILDWSARYIDKLYLSMIITRAFLCDYIGHLFLSIRVPHESLNNCLRHGAAQTIFKAIDTPRSHSETCPILSTELTVLFFTFPSLSIIRYLVGSSADLSDLIVSPTSADSIASWHFFPIHRTCQPRWALYLPLYIGGADFFLSLATRIRGSK